MPLMRCRVRPGRSSAAILIAALAASIQMSAGELEAQSGPHLTGRFVIDLTEGGIASDVCLRAVPVRGDQLTLVLNRAFTIKRLTGVDAEPTSMELEPGGAAIRYTFTGVEPLVDGSAEREAHVCLEYTGRFPVYDIAVNDYRGEDSSSVV